MTDASEPGPLGDLRAPTPRLPVTQKSPLGYYSHPFARYPIFYRFVSLGCIGGVKKRWRPFHRTGNGTGEEKCSSVTNHDTPPVPLTEREDRQESYALHVAWDLESLVVPSVIAPCGEFNSFTLKQLPPLSRTLLRLSAVNRTRSGIREGGGERVRARTSNRRLNRVKEPRWIPAFVLVLMGGSVPVLSYLVLGS
ncbi:hypothetical protein BHE74_00033082 [Ensete ventricosum]|nr:hypothetical protein BHE74_00033082 [Ensete ventricosum]